MRLDKMKMFSFYRKYDKSLWWFRLGKSGWGLHGKSLAKHGMLFSERNGFRPMLVIGRWQYKILKPKK